MLTWQLQAGLSIRASGQASTRLAKVVMVEEKCSVQMEPSFQWPTVQVGTCLMSSCMECAGFTCIPRKQVCQENRGPHKKWQGILKSDKPQFKFWLYYLLVTWSWTCSLISLRLNFLIFKVKMLISLTCQMVVRLSKAMHVKYLAECWTHRKYSINDNCCCSFSFYW